MGLEKCIDITASFFFFSNFLTASYYYYLFTITITIDGRLAVSKGLWNMN